MSKVWNIYSKNTPVSGTPKYVAESLEYHDIWMGEEYVTVTIVSPKTPNKTETDAFSLEIGDYIQYRGRIYSIYNVPSAIKQARVKSYGEAFKYENVKFSSRAMELTEIRFLDIVLGDNQLHYTSLPSFQAYCKTVEDLVDRLQANTDRINNSHGYWFFITPNKQRTLKRTDSAHLTEAESLWNEYFSVDADVSNEKKNVNIQVDNATVWDGLSYVKQHFGLNFITNVNSYGRNVIIGASAKHTENIFRYGKGNGLHQIERVADSDQLVVTKLYAYGSDKNLPYHYYNDINIRPYLKVTGSYSSAPVGISVLLENIAYDGGAFTNMILDNGSLRWYTFTCKITNGSSSVICDGNAEMVRISDSQNCTVRLYLASTGSTAGMKFTPQDKIDAVKDIFNNTNPITGIDVIFLSDTDISKFPSNRHTALTDGMPNNMSVNCLMLPGFPAYALNDVVKCEYNLENDETRFYVRNTPNDSYSQTASFVIHGDHVLAFSSERLRPWIKSPNANILGIKEGDVHFTDETDDNGLQDVHPSIEGMTENDVFHNGSTARLDEIVSISNLDGTKNYIDDNGVFSDVDTIPNFKVYLKNLGFDLRTAYANAGSSMNLCMKDGYCGGRNFVVKGVNSVVDASGNITGWELIVQRLHDESLELYFPYSDAVANGREPSSNEPYQIRTGDHFVLTDILIQDTNYIYAASVELFRKACLWLVANDYTRFTYLPRIDEIFMARDKDTALVAEYDTIKAGHAMDFEDEDLQVNGSLYIDQLTIKENGNQDIPTFDVTLREDKQVGKIGRMQNQINTLSNIVGNGMTQFWAKQHFISKLNNDTAAGLISFFKGMQIGQQFVSGILGEGGVFRMDADGKTYLEADKMYVRMKAYFDTVEIREYQHTAGNRIASVAGNKCVRVEWIQYTNYRELVLEQIPENRPYIDYFRCYFRADDGDDKVRNNFAVGDMVYCHITSISGEYDDPNEKGLNQKHYWRLCISRNTEGILTEDGEAWIDLSNHSYETFIVDGVSRIYKGYQTSSDYPEAQDSMVQLGNIDDGDRQGAIVEFVTGEDAPSYQIYQGIGEVTVEENDTAATVYDPYDLTDKNMIGFGYDSSKGRAYMNVYGDMYVGEKGDAPSTYIRYTQPHKKWVTPEPTEEVPEPEPELVTMPAKLEIKAIIDAQSTVSGIGGNKTLTQIFQGIQDQLDGVIETWFYGYMPVASLESDVPLIYLPVDPEEEEPVLEPCLPYYTWANADHAIRPEPLPEDFPAEVTTERDKHLGDMFYDNSSGYAWRFAKDTTSSPARFQWLLIPDSATVEALRQASEAKTLANNKRRVFTTTPYSPYDAGDLWVNVTGTFTKRDGTSVTYNNDILKCIAPIPRSGAQEGDPDITTFHIDDWSLASGYTDDTKFNNYLTQVLNGVQNPQSDSEVVAQAMHALKGALNENTTIDGGLILTSLISLKNQGTVWSGISGQYQSEALGKGIAAWYGGAMADMGTMTDAQKTAWDALTDEQKIASNTWAKSLFRFDGSGYLAANNIYWNAAGSMVIRNLQTIYGTAGDSISINTLSSLSSIFATETYGSGATTELLVNPQNAFSHLFINRTGNVVTYPQDLKTINDYSVLNFGEMKARFVTVDFFSALFGALKSDNTEMAVNDANVSTLLSSIKAKVGFWTEQYVSALGKNGATSGGGTISTLYDVELTGTLSNGQVLKYNSTTHKWYNADDEGVSTVDWKDITGKPTEFTPAAHNHDTRYYISNGTIYLGSNSLTPLTSFTETDPTVPSWAKKAQKPSYAFSEIIGTATAVQLPNIENLTNFSTKVYDASTTRTKNTFLAAPDGENGLATFRAIASDDIPALAIAKITGLQTAIDSKALNSIKIQAGNGLTGGGTLEADRTLSILLQTNSGLSVNANGLKLDIVNNSSTSSNYKAISATQFKALYDFVHDLFTKETENGVSRIKANYGLYTEQFLSALGLNSQQGSSGALEDLVDVNISNPQNNEVLKYNGQRWVNAEAPEAYVLPTATSAALGGIKIGYTTSGKNYAVQLANGQAYVNVPWTDTTYTLPTASADTLGGVKIGTTLAIANGVLNLPTTGVTAGTYKRVTVDDYGRVTSGDNTDIDTNTWRNIYVGGTSKVGSGIDTKAINFKAGSNVAIAYVAAGTGSGQSGNANYFDVVISATDTTYSAATQSVAGLMSATDKKKLDGIAESANNYSLPLADSGTRGGVQIGYSETNSGTSTDRNYAVQLSSEKMYVNVPWANTWRGIQNNLTSDSTTDSLSAKQGKTLKGYTDTLFGYFTNGVANSAAKLATAHSLWGNSFDGTGDINGNIVMNSADGTYIQIGAIRIVYDSENNALKVVKSDGTTAANFYATGGVSALGSASGGGGGATSLDDLVNVEIASPTDGQVLKYNAQTHKWVNGNDEGVTSVLWSNVLNKPTTIGGYGITDAYISNGVIHLGGVNITPLTSFTETDPTVPAWAKASTKPSYAFSEIIGTAASSQIPSLDASKITSGTFDVNRIPNLTVSKITDLSKYYLQLSGGTVNGVLRMGNNAYVDVALYFKDQYASLGTNRYAWMQCDEDGLNLYFDTDVTDVLNVIGGANFTNDVTIGNKLGIGVTNALYALHVAGSGYLSSSLSVGANLAVGGTLKIGDIYIAYDSTNNALKVYKLANGVESAANFYALGGVSALGYSASGGGGGGASALSDLTDVQITNVANGQILRYDGTHWINVTPNYATTTQLANYLPLSGGGTITGNNIQMNVSSSGLSWKIGNTSYGSIVFSMGNSGPVINLSSITKYNGYDIRNSNDTYIDSANSRVYIGGSYINVGGTNVAFGTSGADYVPITIGSTTKNVLTRHQSLSGLATTSQLGNYLPLSGGTLTGTLTMSDDLIINGNNNIIFDVDNTIYSDRYGTNDWRLYINGLGGVCIAVAGGSTYLDISDSGVNINGNAVATQTWVQQQGFLTSSSISDMATKTWVGNNYLALTGGTMRGILTLGNSTTTGNSYSSSILIGLRTTGGTRASYYTSNSYIHGGEDNASQDGANVQIGTWYGFGIYPTISGHTRTQGKNSFWHNARTGNTYTWGDFYCYDGTNNNKVATQSWVGQQGYLTSLSLGNLTNVSLSSTTNGQVLTYQSSNGTWVNKSITFPVTSVAGYTGAVTVANLATALSLSNYATETWVTNQGYITSSGSCAYATSAGSAKILGGNVAQGSTSLADGDVLVYDSGAWYNTPRATYLGGYATQTWVGQQGFLTSIAAATASALGGIKVGYTTSGKNYKVQLDSSNNAYVNVPWENTTYTLAGLMGSSAKGSTTQPIYWTGSAFANTSYTLGKSVPSDAVFTDHYAWSDITGKPTTLSGYGITDALNKLTYEYSKEIAFGSTGKLLIGKFPCYDSNVTIYLDATTNTTYHATIILATQNINNSHGGAIHFNVYGDETDSVAPNLYLYYPSNSRYIEIYFSPSGWSKNIIHIKCSALTAAPTNICESVSEIPSSATTKPTNVLNASASVNYATTAGSANSVAWSNVSSHPTKLSQFTNDSGFVTSSALGSYLPKSGGTLTGALNMSGNNPIKFDADNNIYADTYGSNSSRLYIAGYDGIRLLISNPNQVTHSYLDITDSGVNINGNAIATETWVNNKGYVTSSGSVNYATSAGSVTKLQTPRTIWGQSFDGSANISGILTGWTGCAANVTDTWSDGTNSHPWYGIDHRYANTGVYSTTIADYFGLTFKTAYGNISMTGDGNVGIGTTSPSYKLHVNGSINGTTVYENGNAVATQTWVNNKGYLTSAPVTSVCGYKGAVTAANIASALNNQTIGSLTIGTALGIGTAPATGYSIDADGSIRATGIYVGSHAVRTANDTYISGNTIYIGSNSLTVSSGGSGTVTSVATGTGLTGGTITSTGTISINSTYQTYISHGNTAYGWGNHANAGYLTSSISASTYLLWGTKNGHNAFIGYYTDQNDGTFGFSIDGTTYRTGLAIGGGSGNLLYKGNIVYHAGNYGGSDIRLKDVLEYNIEPSVESVSNAPSIRFMWNDNAKDRPRYACLGSIAQYWRSVLPDTVHEGIDGYLCMQYDVIALLSAISVAKRVTEHERRIETLERENALLRMEINELKDAA